jgi:hypothetical protein
MWCQSSSQIKIHPQDLSFLCAWSKQGYILLLFCIQPEMTFQQLIESMEQMTPNVSVFVSIEPQLVSYSSNPNFYILNPECTD